MSDLAKYRISRSFMIEINNYCETDKDIAICRTRKEYEAFRNEWSIAWFRGDEKLYDIPFFNTNRFKEALRKFLSECYDSINRFRFFGYYTVRDMEQWLLRVRGQARDTVLLRRREWRLKKRQAEQRATRNTEAVGAEEPEDMMDESDEEYAEEGNARFEADLDRQMTDNIMNELPFGLVTLGRVENQGYGDYVLVEDRLRMRRSIVFECSDRRLLEQYNFSVYDAGAQFVPISLVVGGMHGDGRGGFSGLSHGGLAYEQYVPVTPYFSLWVQKMLIEEAEIALFDANSMLTYPETSMVAKPLPDSPIGVIPEEQLYAMNSVLGARQSDAMHKQTLSMQNAHAQRQRLDMERAAEMGFTGGTLYNIMNQRRALFQRPSLLEGMRYIPQSVEINPIHQPSPIVRIEDRVRKYENDICSVMSLPYIFFKPHINTSTQSSAGKSSSGGSGGGKTGASAKSSALNESNMAFYQKQLEDEVHKQQEIFDQVFREIYRHTFYTLDELFTARPSVRKQAAGGDANKLEIGIHFERSVTKSDAAIQQLMPIYMAGLLEPVEIRKLIFRSWGIDSDPAITDEEVAKRRALIVGTVATATTTAAATTAATQQTTPSDNTTDKKAEKQKRKREEKPAAVDEEKEKEEKKKKKKGGDE